MTETEWLTLGDPAVMLDSIENARATFVWGQATWVMDRAKFQYPFIEPSIGCNAIQQRV